MAHAKPPRTQTLAALMKRPGGPLTVARARALTAPIVTKKHVSPRVAKATPRDVGIARRQLDARHRAEIDHEIEHYNATYALLKKRGVAGTKTLADRQPPLRILAEGDSWFRYPLNGGGVIHRLQKAIGLPILNLATPGDEVRSMLGVKERKNLDGVLQQAASKGEPFDVLLFSGGGNDIVGDAMCLWVKTWDPAQPPAAHLDTARFGKILGVVQSAYEDLFATMDRLSPNTRIFLHDYDFALPTNKGVCFLGPWLWPSLAYRGFPGKAQGAGVVKEMLLQFKRMLAQFAARPNVTLIPTQGTLTAQQWANELHPTPAGFDAITGLFHAALRTAFPERIA
jgi:hypothetical protein